MPRYGTLGRAQAATRPSWTATSRGGPPRRSPTRSCSGCKKAGVPAGVVQSCADLHRDPQIAARPGLVWLEHPEMGRTPYEAWAFASPGAPGLRRAPCLGEHTDEVLRELLGLTPEDIAGLRAAGVLA